MLGYFLYDFFVVAETPASDLTRTSELTLLRPELWRSQSSLAGYERSDFRSNSSASLLLEARTAAIMIALLLSSADAARGGVTESAAERP